MIDSRPLTTGSPRGASSNSRHSAPGAASLHLPLGRPLIAVLVLAIVGVLSFALPGAALAQEPMRLQDQVTDLTQRQVLAAGRSRIEQLRDIERRAPEILAALPAQIDAQEARVPKAD